MIRFCIGGRSVNPRDLEDAVTAAILEKIGDEVRAKIGSIRDPDTGEFPTVIIFGDSIEQLSVRIEASPKLVQLVKERLGMSDENPAVTPKSFAYPKVFLSYASENRETAQQLAERLQESAIETWWDRWCIYPGDSLRQKIDEGIAGCTHFLVLLTPEALRKPWVNQEMDAGFVRKLNDQCRFLPVRFKLPASELPPTLSGMHSPSIETEEDIKQLINDIYGVSRRPPIGKPPAAVANSSDVKAPYSAAAMAVARVFVERSKDALPHDPLLRVDELAKETGLTIDDINDALFELSNFLYITLDAVGAKSLLFAEFDCHWMPWNTAEDVMVLAAHMMNDPAFPADPTAISERLGWKPRRLNPVISYMLARNLIRDHRALGLPHSEVAFVVGTDHLRRFLKSRS